MEKQITWSIRFIALFICSLSFLNVHAQKNTNVKGTVYDSNNEPLVGATVSVKGIRPTVLLPILTDSLA